MKTIVYTSENGNAAVAGLADGVTETVALAALRKVSPDAQILDVSALPKDTDFFDAWVFKNGAVQVSLDKARDVAKQKMRVARQPLFAELDIAFQRALETNASTSAIVAKKQALRDATKLADSAKSLDDLRQAIATINMDM